MSDLGPPDPVVHTSLLNMPLEKIKAALRAARPLRSGARSAALRSSRPIARAVQLPGDADSTTHVPRERQQGQHRTVPASVLSVHRNVAHSFSKPTVNEIELVEGFGVVGDVHAGATVKHRSRVAKDPSAPNLRQVHLIHRELFDLVATAGFTVAPGELGENITTSALELLQLPVGARLRIGAAVLTVTGLRNPCLQINTYQAGLLKQVLRQGEDGSTQKLAGVMSIVSRGGTVRPRDAIEVLLPPEPHFRLTGV